MTNCVLKSSNIMGDVSKGAIDWFLDRTPCWFLARWNLHVEFLLGFNPENLGAVVMMLFFNIVEIVFSTSGSFSVVIWVFIFIIKYSCFDCKKTFFN